MTQVRALWHIDNQTSTIREQTLKTQPGDIQLTSRYSLISTGTELLVARGMVPAALHQDMRVPNMEGDFMLPVKYGYSLVAQEPDNGPYYHIMHPHQTMCSVPEHEPFEIPAEVTPKRATLASNLETALNAVWDARVLPGERVVVVGFGMIGSLIARIVSGIPAAEVLVMDIDFHRQIYAEEFGFEMITSTEAVEPFDVAFHCSGSGDGLQSCLDLLGREGRIIDASWYGTKEVTLRLGGEFHSLRKRIISSQVSAVSTHMRPRWSHRRRKKAVFELLKNPAYDQHITHTVSLDEAARLFDRWRRETPEGLGFCIDYNL
jgi:threonine dehydrogenase-like Zn-dependent dehydrogenase